MVSFIQRETPGSGGDGDEGFMTEELLRTWTADRAMRLRNQWGMEGAFHAGGNLKVLIGWRWAFLAR